MHVFTALIGRGEAVIESQVAPLAPGQSLETLFEEIWAEAVHEANIWMSSNADQFAEFGAVIIPIVGAVLIVGALGALLGFWLGQKVDKRPAPSLGHIKD